MRFAKLDLGALDALAETVPSQFPLDIRNLLRLLQIILLIPSPFYLRCLFGGGGGVSIRGNRLFQDLIFSRSDLEILKQKTHYMIQQWTYQMNSNV